MPKLFAEAEDVVDGLPSWDDPEPEDKLRRARHEAPGPRRRAAVGWAVKESVRARLRVAVRRILKQHGFPPDEQEAETNTVLRQAELLSEGWA